MSLQKDFPTKPQLEILAAFRSSGYDGAKVRQHFNPHEPAHKPANKFLVSYDLMPDGTVVNYQEVAI